MARAAPGAVFVKVGCWKGRSAAFLGVDILRSGKAIALHCVDHFRGYPSFTIGPFDNSFPNADHDSKGVYAVFY